jgi:hypothetical protein
MHAKMTKVPAALKPASTALDVSACAMPQDNRTNLGAGRPRIGFAEA